MEDFRMNLNLSHSILTFTRPLALLLLGMLAMSGLPRGSVRAQALGSIVGTVTDPAGGVIAGAKVTATEVGTGLVRTATSDAQGYYVVASLRPSLYAVSVGAPGFRTFTQKDVTLLADQTLTLNAKLEVGATSEV